MIHLAASSNRPGVVSAMINCHAVDANSKVAADALTAAALSKHWHVVLLLLHIGGDSLRALRAMSALLDRHDGATWQYQQRDMWIDFGYEANDRLERAHGQEHPQYQDSVIVLVGDLEYMIDFSKMEQQNVTTGRVRKVRRSTRVLGECLDPVSARTMQSVCSELSHASERFPDSRCETCKRVHVLSVDPVTCDV